MRKGNFLSGIFLGAVAGAVLGIAFDPVKEKDKYRMKKKVSRALRTAGHMLDSY